MRRVRTTQLVEDFSRYSDFQHQMNEGLLTNNINSDFLIKEELSEDSVNQIQDIIDYVSIGLSASSGVLAITGLGLPVAAGMNAIASLLDVLNGVVYFKRGKYLFGAMSMISVVPLIGDSAKITFNSTVKALGGTKNFNKLLKSGKPLSDDVAEKVVKKLGEDNLKELTKSMARLYDISHAGLLAVVQSRFIPTKIKLAVRSILTYGLKIFYTIQTKFLTLFSKFGWSKKGISTNERIIKHLDTLDNLGIDELTEKLLKKKNFRIPKKAITTKVAKSGDRVKTGLDILSSKSKSFSKIETEIQKGFVDEVTNNFGKFMKNHDAEYVKKIKNLYDVSTPQGKKEFAEKLISLNHTSYVDEIASVLTRKELLQGVNENIKRSAAKDIMKSGVFNKVVKTVKATSNPVGRVARTGVKAAIGATPKSSMMKTASGVSNFATNIGVGGTRLLQSARIFTTNYLDDIDPSWVQSVDEALDTVKNFTVNNMFESDFYKRLKESLPCFDKNLGYISQEEIDGKDVVVIDDKKYKLKYVFYSVKNGEDDILKVGIFYKSEKIADSIDIRCVANSKTKDERENNKVDVSQLNEYYDRENNVKYITVGNIVIGLDPESYERFRKTVGFSEDVMSPIDKDREEQQKVDNQKQKEKADKEEKNKEDRKTPEQKKLEKQGNEKGTVDVLKGKNNDPIDGDKKPKEQPTKREFGDRIKPVLTNQKLLQHIRNVANRGSERDIEKLKNSSEMIKNNKNAFYGKTSEGNDYAFFTNVMRINSDIANKAEEDLKRLGSDAKYIEELKNKTLETSKTVFFLNDELRQEMVELSNSGNIKDITPVNT